MKKRWSTGRKAVVVIVLCLMALPAWIGWEIYDLFVPTTSLWRYRSSVNSFRNNRPKFDTDVVAYFPESILANATNVKFCYDTPPGDVELQLRCVLPQADVAALVNRVQPVALVIGQGSESEKFSDFQNQHSRDYIPMSFRNADQSGHQPLPATFTIYLIGFGHGDKNDANEAHWTYEYGVAVDPNRSEVIYWMFGHAS